MLLDYTHFTNYPTYIAGIDTMSGDEPTIAAKRIAEEVTRYIEELEPQFLRQILGDEMVENTEMSTEIAASLTPIAAKYVYFFYERDHTTFNTIAGDKVKITDQSRIASPQHRLVELWNNMVHDCRRFVEAHANNNISPDLCADIFKPVNIFNL